MSLRKIQKETSLFMIQVKQNNGMERKRMREEQRDELLLRLLLDGTRIFLSDIKRRKIMND